MKTYLQRLAERAEGVSMTHLLIPTENTEVFRDDGSDSSESARDERFIPADAESSGRLFPAPPESAVDEDEGVQRAERATAPKRTLRVELPVTVESTRSESPKLAHIHPEPAPLLQPRSAEKEAAIPHPLEPRKEIASLETSIIEARSTVREPPQPMEVQRDSPGAGTSLPLSQAQHVDPPLRKRRSNPDQGRRSNQPTQDVQPGLLSPIQHIERLVPAAEEIAPRALSDRPVPNLEPPRTGPDRQVNPVASEPRLVIGQLRVDILPAVPAETRGVARVAQWRAGASRPARTSPASKLRFGLRQM